MTPLILYNRKMFEEGLSKTEFKMLFKSRKGNILPPILLRFSLTKRILNDEEKFFQKS